MQPAAVDPVRRALRFLTLLLACVCAVGGGEIRTASAGDAHEALRAAALLVQQGRLEEADQQARLALDNPETRAVALSVLGTIRLQQQRLDESAAFLREAIRLDANLLGAQINLAQI
jgi:tetratricopeptide (TPR) repeat protein